MRILVQLLVAGALAAGPTMAAGALAGVWTDGRLTLTLEGDSEAYAGTLALDGERFELTAAGDADTLRGSFTAGGAEFAFQATLEGGVLRLETDGARYELERGGAKPDRPVNPLAAKARPKLPEGWDEAGAFRFPLPDGWLASPDETGTVTLQPPDAAPGTDEVYVLTEIVGVASPDDAALDAVVRQSMLGPAAPSAVYESETFEPGGDEAMRHTWRLLQRGRRLDAYVKPAGERLIAAVATGLEDKVKAHEAQIQRIAAGFEYRGRPQPPTPEPPSAEVRVDPAAPKFEPGATSDGAPASEVWRKRLSGKRLTRVATRPDGQSATNRMELAPDGTFAYQGSGAAPGAAEERKRGWWRVLTHDGQTYLGVVVEGLDAEEYFPLVARGDEVYFGAQRVFVSDP